MAFSHGSKANIRLGTAGTPTTLADFSIYANNVSTPWDIDTAETSVFGSTFKQFVPGLSNGTISIDGRFDPTADSWLALLVGVASVNFGYYPQGYLNTGTPAYTGSCFMTSYATTTSISDVGTFTAAFQIISARTRTTQ